MVKCWEKKAEEEGEEEGEEKVEEEGEEKGEEEGKEEEEKLVHFGWRHRCVNEPVLQSLFPSTTCSRG